MKETIIVITVFVGQLGLSQEKSRASRFRLKTGIIDVAAGDTHTVYVDGTNQLSVMGDNSKGQYVPICGN